jgi:hypothetical protein
MKTLIASLFTLSILFTGCATVTDANVDLADEPTEETTTMERAGDTWDQKTGDDMDVIIVKPVMTD